MLNLLKALLRPSSLGTWMFFVLNIALIWWVISGTSAETKIIVWTIYGLSVVVSLSPVGEILMCVLAGASPITRTDMRLRLEPVVDVVHERARHQTNGMRNHIRIWLIHDQTPNAYAFGRGTICVTEGVFTLSDDALLGLMAHEVGHLARRHSDVQLVIGGANVFITGFIVILKVLSLIIAAICGVGVITSLLKRSAIAALLFGFIGTVAAVAVWLWTKQCTAFLAWTMRRSEFDADRYAAQIGFGAELALALDTIGFSSPNNGFLRALQATHPNVHDRVGALQRMGVAYSRYGQH